MSQFLSGDLRASVSLWLPISSARPSLLSSPSLRSAIKVESRTDKCQMAERLRSVPQLFPTPCNLLREHTKMIAEAQHIFKYIDCPHKVLRIIYTCARQCLNQPERAHAKGTFPPANTVFDMSRVVAIDETGGCKAALFGSH